MHRGECPRRLRRRRYAAERRADAGARREKPPQASVRVDDPARLSPTMSDDFPKSGARLVESGREAVQTVALAVVRKIRARSLGPADDPGARRRSPFRRISRISRCLPWPAAALSDIRLWRDNIFCETAVRAGAPSRRYGIDCARAYSPLDLQPAEAASKRQVDCPDTQICAGISPRSQCALHFRAEANSRQGRLQEADPAGQSTDMPQAGPA